MDPRHPPAHRPFLGGALPRPEDRRPTAIGEHVVEVQALWKDLYDWPAFPADGSQWDRLFEDGERFRIGALDAEVIFSPGHTLASVTYRVGNAAFVHDTVHMPDSARRARTSPGETPRCSGGASETILALPEDTSRRLGAGGRVRPEHELQEALRVDVDRDPETAARLGQRAIQARR